MKTTVMIPFKSDCPWRKNAVEYVYKAYKAIALEHGNMEVRVASDDSKDYSRAAMRNKAVEWSDNGVVVLADADILPNPIPLLSAIRCAQKGGMHLPYNYYRALSKDSTSLYYANNYLDVNSLPMAYDSYDSTAGIIVIRKDQWWKAGGMDERITGWGWEDTAFYAAAETMLGPVKRHKGTINHLWHPFAGEIGSEGYLKNKAIYERYEAAKTPRQLEEILNEDDRRIRR